ncbi:MAG: hypothetical protein P4L45_09865 [Ignavibacteriaceae bacterium]|nr:hypothetical protein [Ignavibacteriaceae bacterium]
MQYNALQIQTLKMSGSTPFRNSIIDDSSLYFVKNEHSSTYIISIDVEKAKNKDSGFWSLLNQFVENIGKTGNITRYGIALNIEIAADCEPEYSIVLGISDGINNYSEIITNCQTSEAEAALIQEYVDLIDQSLHRGQAKLVGKMTA